MASSPPPIGLSLDLELDSPMTRLWTLTRLRVVSTTDYSVLDCGLCCMYVLG